MQYETQPSKERVRDISFAIFLIDFLSAIYSFKRKNKVQNRGIRFLVFKKNITTALCHPIRNPYYGYFSNQATWKYFF
jgi:hypothetical protein